MIVLDHALLFMFESMCTIHKFKYISINIQSFSPINKCIERSSTYKILKFDFSCVHLCSIFSASKVAYQSVSLRWFAMLLMSPCCLLRASSIIFHLGRSGLCNVSFVGLLFPYLHLARAGATTLTFTPPSRYGTDTGILAAGAVQSISKRQASKHL